MNIEFIKAMLPEDAKPEETFFICTQSKDKVRFRNNPISLQQFQETPEIALAYDSPDMHIYFTPITFKKPERKKRYAYRTQSIIIDVDDFTLSEVKSKIQEASLPHPTAIVSTGRGIHIWWKLSQPIEVDETYVAIVKNIANKIGGDTNAIKLTQPFRVPDTYNLKLNPPKKAEIIEWKDHLTYDIADFQEEEYTIKDVDVSQLVDILKPYYINGNRHTIILGLAGILKKSGKTYEEAMDIIQTIVEELNDEEMEDRLKAVQTTYQKDEVAGFSLLRSIAIDLPEKIIQQISPAPEDIAPLISHLIVIGKERDGDKWYSIIYDKKNGKTIKYNITDQRNINLMLTLSIQEDNPDKLKTIKKWLIEKTISADEIDTKNILGKGYWKIDGKMLYNGEVSLYLDDNDIFNIHIPPYFKGYILDRFNTMIQGASYEQIKEMDGQRLQYIPLYDTEMYQFFSQFNFENGNLDAIFLTSIVYTALIGKEVNERFLVYIYGNKATGKSTIFRYLGSLTQGLTIPLKNATEFAKFKALATNQIIPIYDDFEPNYPQNIKTIDQWKDNTQGMALMLRGKKDQSLNEYRVYHIPFFNSISFSISDEAVASRIFAFHLLKPNSNKTLDIPNSTKAFIQNTHIIATILKHYDEIKQLGSETVHNIIPPHERIGNMLIIPVGIMRYFQVNEEEILNIINNIYNKNQQLTEEYSNSRLFWKHLFTAKPDYRSPKIDDMLESLLYTSKDADWMVSLLAKNGILVDEFNQIWIIQKCIRLVDERLPVSREAFLNIVEDLETVENQRIKLKNGEQRKVRKAYNITQKFNEWLEENGLTI